MNEALLKAADLIEASTWWQGKTDSDEPPHGCHCAQTAIAAVTGMMRFYDAMNRLRKHLGTGTEDIIAWNDTPGRTKEEVIAALRAAAEMP